MDTGALVPASTRIPLDASMRVDEIAEKETRTRGAVLRILVVEALNERECRDAIRQAEGHQQTAQEFMASLDARVERKQQEEIE